MNSINQQQKEENFKNLYGEEAIKKIKQLTDASPVCFFCTNIETGNPFYTRPMNLQKLDDDGNLWFLSAIDSNKDTEIRQHSTVQLLFKGSDYSDFLSLYGTASVSQDKQKIKELWNPMLKTWFTEGEDDPRISVIKVEPSQGYYWDTKHNQAVAFIKRVAGAVMGETLDDSIEGNIVI